MHHITFLRNHGVRWYRLQYCKEYHAQPSVLPLPFMMAIGKQLNFSLILTIPSLLSSEMLPANLIQAQRDYFGAHTYELLSDPGKFVHTNWTGHGGNVSASTYSA